MIFLCAIPFVLQGIAMFVDEFYFHHQRGLPLWERLGHPLDTLTVLLCFAYLLWVPVQLPIYIALATFSCLFITKDEFIHQQKCNGGEAWLHSLLFILHPVVLFLAYEVAQNSWRALLLGQFCLAAAFFLYQFFYWNLAGKKYDDRQ